MAKAEFEGQREGERVELVVREKISTAWRGLAWLVLWTGIGYVPMLLMKVGYGPMQVENGEQVWFYVWLGCLGVGVICALWAYMKWYFSYFLITNQRIRRVVQKGLFRKEVVDLGLDKVLGIRYKSGMFGGRVALKTQAGVMVMKKIRDPERVYNLLQDLMSEVENEHV